MENKTIIQPQDEFLGLALKADAVVAQQALVKDVIRKVMKKNVHFGVIPGCEKPTLYKPGAEVLNLTFRLSPDYITETVVDGKHMTVRSKCVLTHIPTGKVFGSGEAICTTKEKKYRIRKDQGKIVENANLEDCWNTVLKIGNKRALIAAVLNVTACSDEFTQDMGEEAEPLIVVDTEGVVKEPIKEEPPKEPAKAKEEQKQPETNGKLTWVGEIQDVNILDSNGDPVWELVGYDGTKFKTADNKVVAKGIEKGTRYVVTYEVNGKGTKVALKMKESKSV